MTMERIVLQTIKFDLMVEHPYAFLLKFAKHLKGTTDFFEINNLIMVFYDKYASLDSSYVVSML